MDDIVTKKETQRLIIIRHLLDFGSVSAREMIFTHGVTRTAARIKELRTMGWRITTMKRRQGEMAVYRLDAGPEQ
jgi:hypothetical protein